MKCESNAMVVQNNKIIIRLNYNIKKLIREVNDKILVIDQLRNKCKYKEETQGKNRLLANNT